MSDSNLVVCPGCQAEYDGTGYDAGDKFECPSCKQIVTVGGGEAAAEAPGAKVARMPSRGTTRRTRAVGSRPPSVRGGTSKMRVVNEAVGMGMTAPGQDPRGARRAQSAPPPAQEGGDKSTMLILGGLGALMAIGGLVFLLKHGGDDKKKKKPVEADKKAEQPEGASSTGGTDTKQPDQPRRNDVPGSTKEMQDHVSQVLSLLKGKAQDSVFWRTSAALLKYGPPVVGELIERFNSSDKDSALAARAIVSKMTGWRIPEDTFESQTLRERIKADVYGMWVERGVTMTLPSEADYTSGAGAIQPPDPGPKPPDSGGPVGGPKPTPAGGRGEAAMRRDLPQHLANYATGTGEERDKTIIEVRGYGKAVIPLLIQNLNNDDFGHARAANSMLKEFTKQEFGNLPAEDRKDFIKKWDDWWKANEGTFSM